MMKIALLLITTLFTAPPEEDSVARDTVLQSLKNRMEYRNVRFGLRIIDRLEFMSIEKEGTCMIEDDLVRVELRSKGVPHLRWTYVKDSRFFWMETSSDLDPDIHFITKMPKGWYHSFYSNMLSIVDRLHGVHDPWQVLTSIQDDYALKFKGIGDKEDEKCLCLEGELRAERFAWITDEHDKDKLDKMKKMQMWIYQSTFAPARIDLLDGISSKPRFSMEFFDYETNVNLPRNTFDYSPPEGKYLQDMDSDAKKAYRLVDTSAVPNLPSSDKALFDPVPGYSRMEVILHKDGTIETGGERYAGEDGIYGLLYHAAHLYGRTSSAEAVPNLSDIDLVVYAAPDVPQLHLRKIMIQAGCDPVFIYRFHIAVKDKKTGEPGSLPIFLPRLTGAGSSGGIEPDPCRICIYENESGPFFSIWTNFVTEDEVTCESVEDLKKIMEQVKKQHPDVRFTVTLGGVPLDADLCGPATMGDLVEAFNLLLKMGADTKSPGYVEEIEEIPVVVEEE
jgi:hypothetical protein